MSSAKARARISKQETLATKLLPLALVLIIFFNELPFLPVLSNFDLVNLLTGTIFLGVAGAFAFEMRKTRLGGETNFGTIVLAVFVVSSLIISAFFFVDLYDFGTNRTIDILIGIYFFAAILLLSFQASKELITGRRARMSKKEKA